METGDRTTRCCRRDGNVAKKEKRKEKKKEKEKKKSNSSNRRAAYFDTNVRVTCDLATWPQLRREHGCLKRTWSVSNRQAECAEGRDARS